MHRSRAAERIDAHAKGRGVAEILHRLLRGHRDEAAVGHGVHPLPAVEQRAEHRVGLGAEAGGGHRIESADGGGRGGGDRTGGSGGACRDRADRQGGNGGHLHRATKIWKPNDIGCVGTKAAHKNHDIVHLARIPWTEAHASVRGFWLCRLWNCPSRSRRNLCADVRRVSQVCRNSPASNRPRGAPNR